MTRLFGTNGVRGVFGRDMTPELVVRLSRAIGVVLGGGRIALATDTRLSGPSLKAAATAGLVASGCQVVDIGTVPTPCAQLYVRKKRLAGGVVITASHNPPEFNGVKVIDREGMEVPRGIEETIEARYDAADSPLVPWDALLPVEVDASAVPLYLGSIESLVDAPSIRARKFKVILDCGNGAGCVTSPELLSRLGCTVATLNGQPDGRFPGRLPEPTPDRLEPLARMVTAAGADLGIAHDGDADRTAFIDERGRFVEGDRVLSVLARVTVSRHPGVVVTPVSSSSCVEEVVRSAGGSVMYTKVGAPIVARTIYEMGAVFGGEENGGFIFPEHQFCRDGAMSAARVLEVMASEGEPLSRLVDALPRFVLRKGSVRTEGADPTVLLGRVRTMTEGRRRIEIDGVKLLEDDGWVLIRPSGTEPLFRIFAEARDEDRAGALLREGEDLVRRATAG